MVNDMLPDLDCLINLYENGERLDQDKHFLDHIEHEVPIQVYLDGEHVEIGFVERFCSRYVRINNVDYDRTVFTFISRPGY